MEERSSITVLSKNVAAFVLEDMCQVGVPVVFPVILESLNDLCGLTRDFTSRMSKALQYVNPASEQDRTVEF